MPNPKGRFRPGVSGNPSGRPKGAKNKIPAALKRTNALILESLQIEILLNLEKLNIKEKADLYAKILAFELPRFSSVQQESIISVAELLAMPFERQKQYILSMQTDQDEE